MKTKIYIEWSPLYENDIMTLARSNDDYLTANNCVYMYTAAEEESELPKPLYIDTLSGNVYYDTIKEKLIENLGRTEIQDINHQANWSMAIAIAKVYTDTGEANGHQLEKVRAHLARKHDPTSIEEVITGDFEFVHLTENLASVQRDAV
jgi:hypothetical protein